MAELRDELLTRLLSTLAADPGWEPHGDTIRDAWGAGQWVKFTDPDGRQHYFRIVVEPYRRAD